MQEYRLVDLAARRVEMIDLPAGWVQREDPVRSAMLPDLSLSLEAIFA